MENYYFDENGLYTGFASAYEDCLPPSNALRIMPPDREGYWPVVNQSRDGWVLHEDHRRRNGWLNGEPAVMGDLGPLPQGWSDNPPEPEPLSCEEERRRAYAAEADPVRDCAAAYQLEAEAWRACGKQAKAAKAMRKYQAGLAEYLAAKQAIRLRFPDADADDVAAADPEAFNGGYSFVSATGVRHRPGCGFARGNGEWLEDGAIPASGKKTRPCRRCKPALDSSHPSSE